MTIEKKIFVIKWDPIEEHFTMTWPDGVQKLSGLIPKLLAKEAWANDADEIKHDYDLRLADPY